MTISVSKVYPSPWISPDDITRPFTLVIKTVTVEEFRLPDGTKERKIVLAFTRTEKRLPLNKTQAKTLAKLLGDDAEQWMGSTIVLAPAVAPNRKATIAVGVPHDQHQVPSSEGPQQLPVETYLCETCGATGPDDHHPDCPDR
jgi:hypothetical protein